MEAGHGEERTENMPIMFLTLEVSKLSGWLNAAAFCRESNRGHTVRCEGAGQQTGAMASSVKGRARLQIRGGARGGAHAEHVVHGRDAGGVKAQRLVERIRALPRVGRRVRGAGRGAAREAAGGRQSRSTQRAGEGSTAD